jgi:hypothetical protein
MSVTDLNRFAPGTPGLTLHVVKFVGGTTAVTKVYGEACSVTYVSTGIVDVTFPEQMGTFEGLAGIPVVPGDHGQRVKGYTCVPGVYNATTRTLRLNITGASESLVDLAALQWLTLIGVFKVLP